jgi:hypothetical protein
MGGWFTLALEFSLGVLIWFRRFRYPLLLLGLLFHLGIEYALNLPMFSWDVITGYILFVDPRDLDYWWRSVRRQLESWPELPPWRRSSRRIVVLGLTPCKHCGRNDGNLICGLHSVATITIPRRSLYPGTR